MTADRNYIMDSFKVGKSAETIVSNWMVSLGWEIVDVRQDKVYQIKDIDYLVPTTDGGQAGVDIKSDRCFDTGNYFIETFSNIEKNKIGWGFGSEADYIMIYYPTSAELHIIDLHALKPWLVANAGKCKTITNSTQRVSGTTYHSQGIVINRQQLADDIGVDNIMIYQIDDTKKEVA
jgi:hypothetical protein